MIMAKIFSILVSLVGRIYNLGTIALTNAKRINKNKILKINQKGLE